MSSPDVIDGGVRVSKLGDRIVSADSTLTIDDQHRKLHEAAAAVGKRIGRVFELLDQSGFTSAGGEVMGEMLARVERRESAGVCFAFTSRNGRNWWEQGPFFSRLAQAEGLYVIRGMESIDYRTPIGRQVFGMQAVQDESVYWTAKQNGDNTVERMMSRQVYNQVPYGYERNGTDKLDPSRDAKALVQLAARASVVERMFTLRDTDYSVGAIVSTLNEDGVPGPRGGRWTKTTVASILANPIYKGTVEYGRRNPKRRPGVKATIRTFQDPALAIVSAAMWARVQSKGRPPVKRTGAYKAGVAGGVLVCSSCGRALRVIGSGDGRLLYGCPRDDSTAAPCVRPVHVKKEAADEYVDAAVEHMLGGRTVKKPVVNARRAQAAREAVDAAQANLDALDDIPPTHRKFAEWVERRTADLEAAEDELALADAEADAAKKLPTSAANYRSRPLIDRNQAARALLRVEVSPPLSRSRFANITERFTLVWR